MERQEVYQSKPNALEKLEKTHPFSLMLNLLLTAGGAFFLYLIVTYVAISTDSIPWSPGFGLAAVICLLLPVYFVGKLKASFENEDSKTLFISLMSGAIGLILFLIFQFFAWQTILPALVQPHNIANKVLSLTIISHALLSLAVLLRLIVLGVFFRVIHANDIRRLIVFSNPFEKLRLLLTARILLFTQLSWVVIIMVTVLFN